MKVIGTSNYCIETVSDFLVKDKLTQLEADKLAEEKNKECPDWNKYFYKAVPDSYKLYTWEP